MIYNLAALAAASLWAFSGLISRPCAQRLGTIQFNRVRISLAFIALLITLIPLGLFNGIEKEAYLWLGLSGLIGIFLGDTLLFAGLKRLGVRLNSVLFSTNAPIAALLGFLAFDEKWSFSLLIGTLATTVGTIIAILYGARKKAQGKFDRIDGKLWIGVVFGLSAALCQAVGLLILKKQTMNYDPFAMNTIRIGFAALALNIFTTSTPKLVKTKLLQISLKDYGISFLSSFMGMILGMGMIVFAVRGGHLGIVSTLSSTTPFLVTLLLWVITKERPGALSFLGSLLVVAGASIIFLVHN